MKTEKKYISKHKRKSRKWRLKKVKTHLYVASVCQRQWCLVLMAKNVNWNPPLSLSLTQTHTQKKKFSSIKVRNLNCIHSCICWHRLLISTILIHSLSYMQNESQYIGSTDIDIVFDIFYFVFAKVNAFHHGRMRRYTGWILQIFLRCGMNS